MSCLLALISLLAISVTPTGYFTRSSNPKGLSDITWANGDRFYAVNDEDGTIYPIDIDFDLTNGTIRSATIGTRVKGEVGKDFEGCAYDRLTGRLLVSDERDSSVREFDPKSGKLLRDIRIPDAIQTNTLWNFAFESVTLSADALTMYVANEEALSCDGGRSNSTTGTTVRIMRFTRRDAGDAWRLVDQFGYRTEKWTERSNPTLLNCCGVSGMTALPDGSLIVLERELSGFTFRFRLYHVRLADCHWPKVVTKKLLYSYQGSFSLFGDNSKLGNFEGITLGPKLIDGSRVLVLIADAGDKYMTKPLLLTLRLR